MKQFLKFAPLAILALASILVAQSAAPHYKQVNKFTLGGNGFWDYLKFDPAANRIFSAHNDSILVVDASTGKKLGELPAKGSHGIALVQSLNRGFNTNGAAGTVSAFDLKTLKDIGEIKVGENPDGIIYDPYSKRVIVMNGRSQQVMAIDPKTLEVTATIPLDGKLEFAATDRGHLYVNVENLSKLAVINTRTWKTEHEWTLGTCEEPSGLAIDRKTDHLFDVCRNKEMVIVDAKTGKIIASLPTGAGTDAARYDAGLNLAFASNGEGTLTVVGQAKDGKYQVEENVPTQRGARTMTLDPKTHKIFLVTAELAPPAPGQRRPTIKPGSFTMLVYAPSK